MYVIKYTQTGISANRIYVLTFIAWTRNTAVTQKRVRSNSLNIQLSKKWSVEEKIIISLREHQLCYLFSFPKKPLRSNKHIKEICGLRKSWVLAASSSRIAEMITAKEEWTVCLWKPQPHHYGCVVTSSTTTASQNAALRFVSQSALFDKSFPVNTKPFTERCEFVQSQGTSCYFSKYLANLWGYWHGKSY